MAPYFSLELSGQYTVVVIIWGQPIPIWRTVSHFGIIRRRTFLVGTFFELDSHSMTSVCVTRSSSRVQTRVQLDSTATLPLALSASDSSVRFHDLADVDGPSSNLSDGYGYASERFRTTSSADFDGVVDETLKEW
jgi:hypothetical protein